ncbi:Histidine biosynthesis bifunctional protein HisB [Buchnera aphidicola (Tetraneura ulmi)]|uniref:bifunctional histidinol-phosphatase/imidazoleglycerol-phosphate dehydratase HisB n=1 Tax=Buchnera aphidicola TaxID=9 RepID=UPI0034649973
MKINKLRKILFIDRDGTLIKEPEINFQVDSLEKIKFEPEVFLSLIKLKSYGYSFVMITNQDGLGTKQFPFSCFNKVQNFIINTFKSQKILFKEIFICPHQEKENCSCRKPKTGLLKDWFKKNILHKSSCYVIGDRNTDMEFANNIGVTGLLYHPEKNNWFEIAEKLSSNKNRYGKCIRKTSESSVLVEIWLDRIEKSNISTGIPFFDHMLDQISVHGAFKMNIFANGDTQVDDHHTVEDTAITFGNAFLKALNNKVGIGRFGFTLPMDESVSTCILDLSGRPYLSYESIFKYQKIGDLSTDMIKHFFSSVAYSMMCTIHLKSKGENDHHIAESMFKSFGMVLKQAKKITDSYLPSSKGIL